MTDARVWVLADDRPGNVSQCLGVAEALAEPFRVFPVRYDRRARWHNLFRGASLIGIAAESRAELAPPWPALAIAAGRRAAPLALWLKKHHGTRLVQIMDPGWPGRDRFDLIAVPRHDQMSPRANVIQTLGSCHRADPVLMAAERAKWQTKLTALPRPWLLLSIGGATKDHPFGPDLARQLAEQTVALAHSMGATILATTSRRTGPEAEAIIAATLPPGSFFHPWRESTENPYLGLLGCANAIVATGDSMNMCSEACTNGGPVFIFSPPAMVSPKHARLHQQLYDLGYARPLGGDPTPWTHPPLNAALDVAREIRARGLI